MSEYKSHFKGITKLIVFSSSLFRPDTYLYESVDEEPPIDVEQNVTNIGQIELHAGQFMLYNLTKECGR